MKQYLSKTFRMLPFWALLLLGLTSCKYIHDDLCPCDHYLHFSYTYNMKDADAFASEMVCQATAKQVELFIFDDEGRFITSQTIAGDALTQNCVKLDLSPGDYRLMAWAGLNETDYTWTRPAPGESIDDWQMSVLRTDETVSRELLGLFHGTLDLNIPVGGSSETVFPLVKNTNKIRLVLLDAERDADNDWTVEDFTIRATTENGDLDERNQPITTETVTWQPYYQALETVNSTDGTPTYRALCAELNTLRLLDGTPTTLRIAHQGTTFFNVDLTGLLLLTKMESHDMGAQEYLDRQDEYVIMVYVERTNDGEMHCLQVVVNDWTIRLDDVNLGR